ncbi:MAG: Gfo/Idh/MocA family oxidoreductase [Deltaproteobacteria bacterium]|nr:Gfo/Idh/MocA family oxidoreductase [Deltaproteobacteria bacterium]TDI99181.1 MAG: Gfo/Idh/MocA family oxidoreductase [Deltaproteobacteria bacterium]TDJ05823.1 MAG: Gfo/Idh/MocA family oxidoreductase [Deltaproteobacteria bacterium]
MALALAVVGLGRAGRARVSALEGHPRARLAATVSRELGPAEATFEIVLEDPNIDGVILCTPNRQHAPAVRAALERGKHVLVEFPLAETAAEGAELFACARRHERVLHVEHIELLSPSQKHQRERVRELGGLLGGGLVFTAPDEGWIGDAERAGSAALRAVARLHRLVDLFGEAQVREARVEPLGRGGYRLELGLAFRRGGEALLIEERGPGLPRQTRWALRCEHGRLEDPPREPPGALFREDLDHFIARVESGLEPYVSEARVLHVLGLVDQTDAQTRS